MDKNNLLSLAFGVLIGFILGYLLHEVFAARQPLRRFAGEGAVTSSAAAPDEAAAAGGGGPAGADAGGAEGPGAAVSPAAPAATAGGSPPPAMAEVQRLRDYVATHPKDADAVLKLANLNFDINNWPRARELYTQYLGLRDPNPDVLTDLGTCYRQLRQFDRALEQFRHAQQVAPGHWKSLFAEVVVLAFDLNQRDAAEQAFTRLQAVAPNQPEVAQLGAALQRQRSAAPGAAAGRQGGGNGSGGGR
ncbi:MAG: tetratricopeptide repeat protein [Acidobacteria bacterium]|nr:tetratricopeptide repeat protein [Acidobacteriota bacterium]